MEHCLSCPCHTPCLGPMLLQPHPGPGCTQIWHTSRYVIDHGENGENRGEPGGNGGGGNGGKQGKTGGIPGNHGGRAGENGVWVQHRVYDQDLCPACLTAAGAASEAPSLLMHPCCPRPSSTRAPGPQVVTFAMPKVTTALGARVHSDAIPLLMVNNEMDIIPHLPGILWPFPRYNSYCHFGHELLLLGDQDRYCFSRCQGHAPWTLALWHQVNAIGVSGSLSGFPGVGGLHKMGSYVQELEKRSRHATRVAVPPRGCPWQIGRCPEVRQP